MAAMQSRIGGGVKAVNGEVGVLIYVHAAADSRKCYLVIKDANEKRELLRTFYNTISVDQIKEIGDLEVNFTAE
jgi:hypothetical protein